ncbi:MAG: dihydrolipoyl dehydrogenase [Desulfovibrio sp.]|jgi:dihydrolipoamide dehydrogenase|nr:dihydrolipoyl dehydrogenase [Desulfovibrio sp.]
MPEIIIIGAGPGGYAAAFEAARTGASVTLAEKTAIGGTCLHAGCIPTKTIRASADALETSRRLNEFGIMTGSTPMPIFHANMAAILARKEKVRSTLCGSLEKTCAALKVRLVHGQAELRPDRTVLLYTDKGNEELHGDAVIIATGSKTFELPTLPVDHINILNSDDALNLDHIPQRMLVVGGGVIGCELAFIFRAFGSEVTIVEAQNRILPLSSVDEEISRLLQRESKKRGIRLMLAQTVKNAVISDGKAVCVLAPSPFVKNAAGSEITVETEAVLVAVGRAPDTDGLNLSGAGVATDAQGWIIADDRMRTSAEGVYAIGDALGPGRVMLAHAASAEGLCAVANCLGKETRMDYSVIPAAIFTSPEIGIVGFSEAHAQQQGLKVRSSLFQYRAMGKSHAMGELSGFFKLVCEEGSGKILGAHIAGAHATDIIAEAALAVQNGLTAAQLARTVHAHPTLPEGMYEAATAWLQAQ